MRILLLSLLLFISSAVTAADGSTYTYDFEDTPEGQHLIADMSKMTLIGEAVKWALVAHTEDFKNNKSIKLMHSVTLFRVPEKTNINKIEFHKIYTYGFIDCRTKELNILNEWYTTTDDIVVLYNRFQAGEYAVKLTTNVILETLEIMSCRVESI